MRCIACDAAEVSERPERTDQGYRRFRCRACGKQFNERSDRILNRAQYPSDGHCHINPLRNEFAQVTDVGDLTNAEKVSFQPGSP
jgi:hypothetical protein